MDTTNQTPDEYLANVASSDQRKILEGIRQQVRKLVPEAEESISYGMPAFKYKNKPLLYYGAFKDHMSLFPTSGPTQKLEAKLADYKTTKGTIQFTLEQPLPTSLIQEIVRVRQREIDDMN